MTPLPHAPGARMVVVTQTSSHEPARQPASQASQPASHPATQPADQPAAQPASQPQPGSQPAEGAVAGVGSRVRSRCSFWGAIFFAGANSDKFGKYVFVNSASFLQKYLPKLFYDHDKFGKYFAEQNLPNLYSNITLYLVKLNFQTIYRQVLFCRRLAEFVFRQKIRHRIRLKIRQNKLAPQNENSAANSAPNSASYVPARPPGCWPSGGCWLGGCG